MNYQTKNLINDISEQLQLQYPNSEMQHAWWLLSAVTTKTLEQLKALTTIALTPLQEQNLAHHLDQLINHQVPFAYVIGSVPFGDLEILTKPPILIPRPETELWCMDLVNQLQKINTPLTILDMCTGSGCIALTLAHALPNAKVYGVDINDEALKLAQQNTLHNKITNVTWLQSNLFQSLPKKMQFDLIVCNPPYISESEWQTLDKSVKDWEDTRALISDDEGLAILSAVIHQAPAWLKENNTLSTHRIPQLMVEIGYQQGLPTKQLFEHAGYTNITVKKDLAGHDRTVSGSINHGAIFKKT